MSGALVYIYNHLRDLFSGIYTAFFRVRTRGTCSMKSDNHLLEFWERRSRIWHEVGSPVRPSGGDVSIYRDFLKNAPSKKRVLILGATPELRDLIAGEEGGDIYVADASHAMLSAMSEHTNRADTARERWVTDNWTELQFPEKFFDVIVGDVILHQMPPDREKDFLEFIHSLLNTEGVFVSRFFFLDEAFANGDFTAIADHVLATALSEKKKLNLLKVYASWFGFDIQTRTIDRMRSSQVLQKVLQTRIRHFPSLNAKEISKATRSTFRDWSPPSEDALLRTLSTSFVIEGKTHADDYPYSKYFPIVCLRPRSA